MMNKHKKCIALALCTVLMLCVALPACAMNYAWGDLYFGFSEALSGFMSGGSKLDPEYPIPFTLGGKELYLPCKLSSFLSSGWDIYDRSTGDYMARYELVWGFSERELTLRKGNQELLIVIRNRTAYDLEMMDCDVEEVAVQAYSFMDTTMPDIEFFGIRPRGTVDSLPKWLKKDGEFGNRYTQCYVKCYDDGSVLAAIDASEGSSIIYFVMDGNDRIEYFSVTAENK